MAKKPTVTTLQSGFNSTEVLNENFENIRDAFDNTLSLDGSTPNAMQADLDLNGNNIIGATGLLINGTDYLADVETAKAAALVAQAAAELAENNAETAEVNAEASETAAGLSATASAASATDALTSRGAAEIARTGAETAETGAAASAVTAASEAATATTKASEASASAAAAAASEAGVDADRVAAQAAASAAAASETNAATSAANAATSETNAANSATSASNSASSASSSAANAGSSATSAATSETQAAASALAAAGESAEATTQASNAAASATAAATSATNAATSETNAATSLTDAESARDQSQAARDTASLHKLAAEAAATSATNTAAALTGFDLEAIASSKAVTAVDVFVYDTSKDSDGGAWRKRTQGTSWYNETLNTATRGSRKEFPAVAVIVAEAAKVTIYDGDDPALPMWMVFTSLSSAYAVRGNVTSIAMVNGLLSVGSEAGRGVQLIDFPADYCSLYTGSFNTRSVPTIVDRNQIATFTPSGSGIVNTTVNDVAMTVLPDAPIDPATGLPVPTIAVATNGGVSVIKGDGTVTDSASTLGVAHVNFDGNSGLWWCRNTSIFFWFYTSKADYSAGDGFGDLIADGSTSTGPLASGLTGLVADESSIFAGGNSYGGIARQGLYASAVNYSLLPSVSARELNALITSDYNTGWMNGDIKGAFLSDTDDTDVTGAELVTNGDGSTTTGWTAYNAVISSVGGKLRVDDSANAGSWSSAVQELTGMVSGKRYTLSMDVDVVSGVGGHLGFNGDSTTSVDRQIEAGFGSGTYTITFTADEHNFIYVGTSGTGTVDLSNISVRLAEEDRSVNGKGLQVVGTVAKNPVATGADLVAYSGFSASNYLEAPYNSDLDFGTGDFCVMGWVKFTSTGTVYAMMRRDLAGSGEGPQLYFNGGNAVFGGTTGGVVTSTSDVNTGSWAHVVGVRLSGVLSVFINGKVEGTGSNTADLSNNNAVLRVGVNNTGGGGFSGSLALLRISATAPSAEQIAKIYNDEKVLFQENAQATLYGASDAVTALAHDDATNLLHVGTSAGRSVFQGLRRVSNTTTAVGTAISASNNLIVEE